MVRFPMNAQRAEYIKVIIVWVIVLVALYAFQEYFG